MHDACIEEYGINLIHRPGKEILVADTLSRKSMDKEDRSLSEAMETQVHTVISTAPVSAERLDDIRTQTAEDKQLSTLKQVIWSDWSETRVTNVTHSSVSTGTTVMKSQKLMESG